jgi:hypothetical protein
MAETVTATAAPAPAAATKKWWHTRLAGPDEVLAFLNGSPAQGPGEMSASRRPDGTVDLYFFSAVGPATH